MGLRRLRQISSPETFREPDIERNSTSIRGPRGVEARNNASPPRPIKVVWRHADEIMALVDAGG